MGICFKCAMRFCRSSASGPQGWRGVKLGNQMSTGNKTTVDISSFKMFLAEKCGEKLSLPLEMDACCCKHDLSRRFVVPSRKPQYQLTIIDLDGK